VTVLTVDILNGFFVNSTFNPQVETGAIQQNNQLFGVSNQAGVRFFIAGQDGTDTPSVSESTTDLTFGSVRIQDFFNSLQVPVYD
jgi:hypothetical protein